MTSTSCLFACLIFVCVCVCFHLALATHSMVTSDVPVTTLVFLGGMMMVGAMGSAGPPTSTGKRTPLCATLIRITLESFLHVHVRRVKTQEKKTGLWTVSHEWDAGI